MNTNHQFKLRKCAGFGLSLASAALPSLSGCVSEQRGYIGIAVQTQRGLTRTVSYQEEESFGIPLKGTLTVQSSDGSRIVYLDDHCDGCLDGKDVYAANRNHGEAASPETGAAPVSSRRWLKLSRLNVLSVATDLLGEHFPDREYLKAQQEYHDWLTWLGGQKLAAPSKAPRTSTSCPAD